jgi:hypothetical protein
MRSGRKRQPVDCGEQYSFLVLLTADCLLTARRCTWGGSGLQEHLLQLSPMEGVTDNRQRYEDEADQKNGADTVSKPVAVLRAVFL